MVTPRGIEPRSMPSESTTLSVELRSHIEKITAAYRKVRSLFSIHGFRRKVNIYMLIEYDFLSGKRVICLFLSASSRISISSACPSSIKNVNFISLSRKRFMQEARATGLLSQHIHLRPSFDAAAAKVPLPQKKSFAACGLYNPCKQCLRLLRCISRALA